MFALIRHPLVAIVATQLLFTTGDLLGAYVGVAFAVGAFLVMAVAS